MDPGDNGHRSGMDDTTQPDPTGTPADRVAPGEDERRGTADPASGPRPVNPPVDAEAVAKGREILDRVKAY